MLMTVAYFILQVGRCLDTLEHLLGPPGLEAGHKDIPFQHCLSVRFVGLASSPIQCSNTVQKMRNKKLLCIQSMSENPTDVLYKLDVLFLRFCTEDRISFN